MGIVANHTEGCRTHSNILSDWLVCRPECPRVVVVMEVAPITVVGDVIKFLLGNKR